MADEVKDEAQNGGMPPGLQRGNRHTMTMAEKRELTKRIAAWNYQDKRFREPATIGELARELGKSADTVKRILAKLPETLAEFIAEIEKHALAKRYIETLENVVDISATKGKDAVAAARFMADMAERHIKAKPAKAPQMPKHVSDVLQRIQEAKYRARQGESQTEKPAVIPAERNALAKPAMVTNTIARKDMARKDMDS